ncbi:hypothetical protein R0K17_29490, partial [Planococcus sp. SIMBA_143]
GGLTVPRIKKTKLFQAYSQEELETYINQHRKDNLNETIVDIKYIDVYEKDISEEFLDLHEEGKTKEESFSAVLLFGEEI